MRTLAAKLDSASSSGGGTFADQMSTYVCMYMSPRSYGLHTDFDAWMSCQLNALSSRRVAVEDRREKENVGMSCDEQIFAVRIACNGAMISIEIVTCLP